MNPIPSLRNAGAFLTLLTLSLTSAALFAAGPIAQSPGDPRTRALLSILSICLLGCIYSLTARPAPLYFKLHWIVLLLPAYSLFQILPLPIALVRFLSPSRAHLAEALRPISPVPSWIPLSVAPSATLYHFLLLAGCASLFLVVSDLTRRFIHRPWIVFLPLLFLGAAEAILGILQVTANPDAVATGTFSIRNHYAGFLEMILPLAVLYPFAILSTRASENRHDLTPVLLACMGFGISALLVAAIVSSLSRMGYIAAVLSVLFVIAAALADRPSSRPITRFFVAAVILAVVSLAFLPSARLLTRFGQMDQEDRTPRWRETTHLIAAYPVFGCGLGGYQSAFLQFKTSQPDFDIDYAHNDYLQYLAELGLLGFTLALAPILLTLFRLRAARTSPSPGIRVLSLACAGSAVAIGIHSLADFNLYVPANLLTFAWILGAAARLGTPLASDRPIEPAAVISAPATLARSRPNP